MRSFSAGEAIGAGFRLIGREPVAFMMWSLAYLVVGLLPQIAVVAAMIPEFAALYRESAGGAVEPTPGEMLRMQARMMTLQPISYLASIVSYALVAGAVTRAVLFPQDRRFFYLRLSSRELWMGLVWLVLIILLVIVGFAAMIPVGVMAVVAAVAGGEGGPGFAGIFIFLLALAAVAAVLWALVRVSLAPVASFAERGFKIEEGWRLSRGQFWKMFLVGVALVAILMVVQIVLLAVGFAVAAAVMPAPDVVDAWLENPEFSLAVLAAPLGILAVVLLSVLSAFSYVLFGAGWAEIYRQLTAPEPAP